MVVLLMNLREKDKTVCKSQEEVLFGCFVTCFFFFFLLVGVFLGFKLII